MSYKVVFIEGNIGTGKSTFLDNVKKYIKNAEVVYEPLDVWTEFKDDGGKNVLQHFYEDPKRYAYTFQTIAFLSRADRMRSLFEKIRQERIANVATNKAENRVIFVERSIFSDKHVFAKNCHLTGLMNKIEWDLYNSWFSWIQNYVSLPEDTVYLYLRCQPDTSFERTTKRNRKEESGVPLDYLKQIYDRHEEWLSTADKVVVANAEVNFRDDFNEFKRIVNELDLELNVTNQ